MVTGLSHVSIAVPDLEAAARQLNDKYGLRVGARMVNASKAYVSPMSSLAPPRSS